MAIRNIRVEGDPILRKRSREVDKFDDRLRDLIEDMEETMRKATGVGLAAPQVGILKRVIVVDIGDGLISMTNPELAFAEGEEIMVEGCLSIPGFSGTVKRPLTIVVKYRDEEGNRLEMKAEGFLARAICHELDHLDGILFRDITIEEVFLEEEDMDVEQESEL